MKSLQHQGEVSRGEAQGERFSNHEAHGADGIELVVLGPMKLVLCGAWSR